MPKQNKINTYLFKCVLFSHFNVRKEINVDRACNAKILFLRLKDNFCISVKLICRFEVLQI